jgi:hypothetical protein
MRSNLGDGILNLIVTAIHVYFQEAFSGVNFVLAMIGVGSLFFS